jgi:hypothetical protein
MGYDGAPPASRRGLPQSQKTQEVLDFLESVKELESHDTRSGFEAATVIQEDLLKALYEPALAVAAAINLVRQGNTGMAPFVGAGGVVLSEALVPLVEHFGDTQLGFEEAFERIGVPVVPFSALPDEPEVETPAVEEAPVE